MRNTILPFLAAAVLTTSAPAFAAPPERQGAAPRAEQARIPFPGLRIRNFRAESREVVYLEDQSRNWYRAELFGPCTDLRFANAIGIDTRGSSSFDRFSAIIVGGERCQLRSLTRSAEPAKAKKRRG
jgi:hypothetical protein